MIGLQYAHKARALACTAASLLAGIATVPAWAESYAATCANADVMSPLGRAPLSVSYEGGAAGTLKLSGAFGEFAVPATLARRKTELGEGLFMDGAGVANSIMPDLAKLQACITSELAGGGAQDADARLSARDACLSRPGFAAAPAQVTATVRFGILPGDRPGEKAAIVEIVRRYAGDTTLAVESFPADCRPTGR